MAQYDRLITFLEREAETLRHRISNIEDREISSGLTGPDAAPSPRQVEEAGDMEKLREIESHIADLRRAG